MQTDRTWRERWLNLRDATSPLLGPRGFLYALLITVPLLRTGAWETPLGGTVKIGDLCALGLVASFFARTLMRRGGRETLRMLRDPFLLSFAIFLAIQVLSLLSAALRTSLVGGSLVSAGDRTAFVRLWIKRISLGVYSSLLAFTISEWIADVDELKRSWRLLLLSSGLASLFGVAQLFGTVAGFDLGLMSAGRWYVPRLVGTASEPSFFADFLVGIVPMALALLLGRSYLGSRWQHLLITILLIASLFLTFSTGGWISAAVAGSLLLTFAIKRHAGPIPKELRFLSIAVLAAVLLSVLVIPNALRGIVGTVGKVWDSASRLSVAVRFTQTKTGLRMFLAHPTLGVGLARYPFLFDDYYDPYMHTFSIGTSYTASNLYALLLAETGILGLGAFILVVVLIYRGLYETIKGASSPHDWMALGGIAALSAKLVSQAALGNLYLLDLWVLIGLLLANVKLRGGRERP